MDLIVLLGEIDYNTKMKGLRVKPPHLEYFGGYSEPGIELVRRFNELSDYLKATLVVSMDDCTTNPNAQRR